VAKDRATLLRWLLPWTMIWLIVKQDVRAAGVQMVASIPIFLCQEQVSLGEGYIKKPCDVRNDYLDLPDGPGLGSELDQDTLAGKLGHDWRNSESDDADDGSVVDW
jgi:galactonate dehydratase